jgi:tetratricopeptide (TPR) repeat protein
MGTSSIAASALHAEIGDTLARIGHTATAAAHLRDAAVPFLRAASQNSTLALAVAASAHAREDAVKGTPEPAALVRELGRAASNLERAVALAPTQCDLPFWMGITHRLGIRTAQQPEDERDLAIERFEVAVRCAPESPGAAADELVTLLAERAEARPEDPLAHAKLARVLARGAVLARRRAAGGVVPESHRPVEATITLATAYEKLAAQRWFRAANLHFAEGAHSSAVEAFTQCANYGDSCPCSAHFMIGHSHALTGELEAARSSMTKAVECDETAERAVSELQTIEAMLRQKRA